MTNEIDNIDGKWKMKCVITHWQKLADAKIASSLVDNAMLGELGDDIVEVGGVRIAKGVAGPIRGLVVDVVPGDRVVVAGGSGTTNLHTFKIEDNFNE